MVLFWVEKTTIIITHSQLLIHLLLLNYHHKTTIITTHHHPFPPNNHNKTTTTTPKTTKAFSMSLSDKLIFVGCAGGVVRVFSALTLNYVTTLPTPHPLGVDVAMDTDQLLPGCYHGLDA